MASLGGTFDPTNVPEDDRNFEPIPAGDYNCQIIESDIVTTKSGGQMLKLTLEVMDGPHSPRRIWTNLNIRNASPETERIAHRALADLCAAVGLGPIEDSEDLHFKPFVASVKITPPKDGYDARNDVKRFKTRGGQPPAGKAPVQQQSRPAAHAVQRATGATGSRPWNSRPSEAARFQSMDDPPF